MRRGTKGKTLYNHFVSRTDTAANKAKCTAAVPAERATTLLFNGVWEFCRCVLLTNTSRSSSNPLTLGPRGTTQLQSKPPGYTSVPCLSHSCEPNTSKYVCSLLWYILRILLWLKPFDFFGKVLSMIKALANDSNESIRHYQKWKFLLFFERAVKVQAQTTAHLKQLF